MGLYLNPGNEGFFESVSSQIYVDKTELIQYTNQVFRTKQKFLSESSKTIRKVIVDFYPGMLLPRTEKSV